MASASLTDALRDTLAVFEEPGVPLTTPEVADRLDSGRRTTYNRLERLVDEGHLDTKKVGANARVWWRPPTVERREREQELRRERELTDQLLETAPVRLAVFRPDGSVERINSLARRELGIDDSDLSEFGIDDLDIYDADGTPMSAAEHPISRIFETGEPVSDCLIQHEGPDGDRRWVSLTATPLLDDDGNVERGVIAGHDVTELKRTEQRLERQRDELEQELDEMFARVDDAFFALDEEWRFTYANECAQDLLDSEGDELVGANVWEEFPEAADSTFREQYERALDTQESVSFEAYYSPLDTWFEVRTYPSQSGLSVYFRDITERKEREQQLRQYQTIVETIDDGVYVVDDESRFQLVNEAHAALTGYDRDELLGAHASLVTDESYVDMAEDRRDRLPEEEKAATTVETELVTSDGDRVPIETRFALLPLGEGRYGRVGVVRDITDRKERERELEESRRRYQTLVEHIPNGAVILFDEDLQSLIAGGELFEGLDFAAEDLEGDPLSDHLPAEIFDTLEPSFRAVFDGQESEFEIGYNDQIRQIQTVPVRDESGAVFAGLVISQDVTQYRETERELERQREQLAALNNLNDVVRDIAEAVIDQSTREQIEATVCARLADSDSYEFAWIAGVDFQTQSIVPRVEVGVDGYLEEIPLSMDPDDPSGQGPGGRAIRTQEIQVTQDALADSAFEPWHEHVKRYGYRSVAAIPITYGDTLYGLLCVYAGRPKAFESQEQEVISQLGEVIGHAIAAIDRKQALTSDEITEIEFRIPDIADVSATGIDMDGTISFNRAVSTGDGVYIEYGTVDVGAIDALEALVDRLPNAEEVTITDRGTDTARFQLRLSEPPVVSAVASNGGYLQRATIEDGDFHLTIHLPVTVDARRIIDVVRDSYPTASFLRRRQITRSEDTLRRVHRAVAADLTDRQQAVLEAAYHAGFFEWPRAATGEEVAESLGIAPSTFSQHLRKGQQRVFESLFSAMTPA